MSTTLIDAGWGVIKIDIADDNSHGHLTLITPSMHDEETHQPAESATCYIEADPAQQLIAVLQKIKTPLKVVGKREH